MSDHVIIKWIRDDEWLFAKWKGLTDSRKAWVLETAAGDFTKVPDLILFA